MIPRIAMLLPNLRGDGAVGMMLTLAEGLQAHGCEVSLLATSAHGERASSLPHDICVVDLRAPRPLRAVPAIVRYLCRERPDVLLASEHYSGLPALYALGFARVATRCVIRQDNTWSKDIERAKGRHRYVTPWMASRLFRRAEIVAVSHGVAEDLLANMPHLRHNVSVIYNPVVSPVLAAKALAPVEHPWLAPSQPPVFVAVGRLQPAKGFDILIDAFAHVAQATPARLLILGDGPDRAALQARIAAHELVDACQLVGYQANPYAFMGKAAGLVLSSRFEGLPTVLIEALAVGAPVIATDCPSGPREILAGGKFGRLVPTENPGALATAIIDQIKQPVAVDAGVTDWLQQFTVEASVARHAALIEAALAAPPPQLRNSPLVVPDFG